MPEVAAAHERIHEFRRRLSIGLTRRGYFSLRRGTLAPRIVDPELDTGHDRTCHAVGDLRLHQWGRCHVRSNDDSLDQVLTYGSKSHGAPPSARLQRLLRRILTRESPPFGRHRDADSRGLWGS